MITTLYVICDGRSEFIFVDKMLAPYLYDRCKNLQKEIPILLYKDGDKDRGVNVSYKRLSDHVRRLTTAPHSIVTTFIDYFKLGQDFPYIIYSQENTYSTNDIYNTVKMLEQDISQINISASNLVPYIQIHEYEMIYFADMSTFVKANIENKYQAKIEFQMKKILQNFLSPEYINNSKDTAPSKRINQIFNKVINMNYTKESCAVQYCSNKTVNNINKIWSICSHFNQWIEQLLQKINQ
jgi:hypothetical protein